MKKSMIAILAATSLLAAACGKEDEEENKVEKEKVEVVDKKPAEEKVEEKVKDEKEEEEKVEEKTQPEEEVVVEEKIEEKVEKPSTPTTTPTIDKAYFSKKQKDILATANASENKKAADKGSVSYMILYAEDLYKNYDALLGEITGEVMKTATEEQKTQFNNEIKAFRVDQEKAAKKEAEIRKGSQGESLSYYTTLFEGYEAKILDLINKYGK